MADWLQTYVSGTLQTWAYRTKLTIDGSKVDENLTDFPVLVHLSNSSGYNNRDVTDMFDYLISSVPIGKDFTGYQMVVNIGSEGTYDTTYAGSAYVIKDGTVYKMWYGGSSGSNTRIIYCDSADGISWSNHQMVINTGSEGTYDTSHTSFPCVILDNDKYKMWYSGHNGSDWRIIYCESDNGTTWSGFQMVVDHGDEGTYDVNRAYAASVIKEDTNYYMWYGGEAASGNIRIIYCDSTDGKTWSNHQMVIDINSEGTYDQTYVYDPFVVRHDDKYKIYYTAVTGSAYKIMYADSTDKTNWSNYVLVIDSSSEGTYDSVNTTAPSVLLDGDVLKVWYTGNNGSNNRIIYAYSQDSYFSGINKIAITGSNGTTQQYVEIEDWDSINQEAWLWTKVPTVSSGTNQYMYLYYDVDMPDNDSYVGGIGTAVSTAVWSNGFSSVWHLNQDPSGGSGAIKDSIVSQNNGTSAGSMTSSDLVSAKTGNGLEFDGSNDYIDFSDFSDLSPGVGTFCISAVVKIISSDNNGQIYSNYGSNSLNYTTLRISSDNRVYAKYRDGSGNEIEVNSQPPDLDDSNFHYLASVRDSQTTMKLWIDDGSYKYTDSNGSVGSVSVSDGAVPRIGALSGNNQEYFGGIIDEVRISNTSRSDAWCKVDYYSCWDNLVNFGLTTRSLYYFSGTVEEFSSPAQRTVRAYRADTGDLMDETTSTISGTFTVNTTYSGLHYIVCLADYSAETFNDLIYGQMIPALTTVS